MIANKGLGPVSGRAALFSFKMGVRLQKFRKFYQKTNSKQNGLVRVPLSLEKTKATRRRNRQISDEGLVLPWKNELNSLSPMTVIRIAVK